MFNTVTFDGNYKWFYSNAKELTKKYYNILYNFIDDTSRFRYLYTLNKSKAFIEKAYEKYIDYLLSTKHITEFQYIELINLYDFQAIWELTHYHYAYMKILNILEDVYILEERIQFLYGMDYKLKEVDVTNHPSTCDPHVRAVAINKNQETLEFEKHNVIEMMRLDENFIEEEYHLENENERQAFARNHYLFENLRFLDIATNYTLCE